MCHCSAVLLGPQGVPGHKQEDQHQENEQALVRECRVELADDRRVAGARRASHSGHQAPTPAELMVGVTAETLPPRERTENRTPRAEVRSLEVAQPRA